jgi:hypothetical protein
MSVQIESAFKNSKDIQDMDEEQVEKFNDDMLKIIFTVMLANGLLEFDKGKALIADSGASVANITSFTLTDGAKSSYKDYLRNVAQSYSKDTAESIRNILARADAEGWSRAKMHKQLKGIMQTDEWRVTRLSVSELNRAQGMSSLNAMLQIQAEAGVMLRKVWEVNNPNACEYCRALNGKEVGLDDDFISLGSSIEGVDGGIMVNGFVDETSANAHPHCTCTVSYKVAI